MKPSTLILIVLAVSVIGSRNNPPPDKPDQPANTASLDDKLLLAEICQTFAYAIESDGQRESPTISTTRDVGLLFNRHGQIASLGKRLKNHMPDWFRDLGRRLADAFDDGQAPKPLDERLRSKAVDIFLEEADKLKGDN